jgi:hypothetical protein
MTTPQQTAQQVWAVNALTFLIALLAFYLSFESVWEKYDRQKELARRQLTSLVDLVSDNIARAVGGTRESMRLLSRMPAMRAVRFSGVLSPALEKAYASLERLDIPEERLKESLFTVLHRREEGTALMDFFQAGIRRVAHDSGAALPDESEGGESTEISALEQANRLGSFLFTVISQGKMEMMSCLVVGREVVGLIDQAFALGFVVPDNPREIERLLQAGLSDRDLIQGLDVISLEGRELVRVAERRLSSGMMGGWFKGVRMGGRPFYPGPVWFDEGMGRPLWNAAMPLRDLQRRPFAVLSAQVDLAFLQELMNKSRISSASHLLIVDEDGIVISHPRFSMVANQVNVSHSNPAVKEALAGGSGFREIRWGSAPFFAAFANLKSLQEGGLPGWGIVYMAPTAEFGTGFWQLLANALLWIIVMLFVLYSLNSFVIAGLEEEWEA